MFVFQFQLHSLLVCNEANCFGNNKQSSTETEIIRYFDKSEMFCV